jgi:PmbA protein
MNSNDILTFLLERAKRLGATAADAVWMENVSVSSAQRLGKSEGIERSESKGIALRVFSGQKIANVSTSDMEKSALGELVERAVSMAKLSPEYPYCVLATPEQFATNIPALDLVDAREPAMEWMQEQTKMLEETALSVKGINNSQGAEAGHSRSHMTLATSEGFLKSHASTSTSLYVCVTAGEDDWKQRDYDYTSARHVRDLKDAKAVGLLAAQRTLEKLRPRKVPTCQVPVVFDPRVGNRLLGSLASAISGAAVARSTSFLKEQLGKQIASASITLTDDPHRLRGLGSRPFDGEGIANTKMSLVEKGVLTSWLLDLRSAKRLGLTTTGHAARGLGAPSPSTSNFYMEAGSVTRDALISDIKSGFYVSDTFGMGVNTITGDYSQGASGFWIENGKLTYPVSELTVAGRMQDMLMHMTPANDLEFIYSTNAPTYRIDGMTVAGT